MARIEAITFDAGGTLIEPWPSVGHVYAEVAARFGLPGLAPEALNRGFAAAWQTKVNFDYSRPAWQRLVRRTFGARMVALPPEFFPALYERFAQPEAWQIYDDVLPALENLKECGWRLGVISNWDERLRPLFARLGLSPYFEVIMVSREVGHAKPAAEIFHRAASALKLPPSALLHIGDSPQEDVAGARGAGCNALLLDRRARVRADESLRTLAELDSKLEQSGLARRSRQPRLRVRPCP